MYRLKRKGFADSRLAKLLQKTEKQVREWASAHALPFPDISEEQRKKITDTLDYPPEGSPGEDGGR